MKIKKAFMRGKLFLNVLAEEPNDENTNGTGTGEETPGENTPPAKADPAPTGTVNFEELIAKARKEERDKLYPQIEKLKTDKNDLLLVVGERDKELADFKKQLAKATGDLTKVTKDVEDGTRTNKTVQELTLTISQLETQLENAHDRYDNDVQVLKIDAYKEKQIALAGGNIIAELVTGSSEEEINTSLEVAKQRYAQIQEQALANVQMPRATNPATSQLNMFKEKTMQEISTMSRTEYAEYRKNLGMK